MQRIAGDETATTTTTWAERFEQGSCHRHPTQLGAGWPGDGGDSTATRIRSPPQAGDDPSAPSRNVWRRRTTQPRTSPHRAMAKQTMWSS